MQAIHRTILFVMLVGLAVSGIAQNSTKVTIGAKGDDVRSVIHDLFKQAKRNFVLSPGVRFALYLSLESVDFDDALKIVCDNASLKYEVKDNVYFISNNAKPIPVKNTPEPEVEESKPKGTLPATVLDKKVTTRLQKRDIREVFAIISKQTGIAIEVGKDIPAFKLDVFFINKPLKAVLEDITGPTKLRYRFTDQLSIAVDRAPLVGQIGAG
jgi:type II secretory pathway component GspD/PulD (secretin)